ncbi:MAG: restriction endonuclease subunit S [Bacteroidota bacterium]|nr:restriction endonuclease subunit S [Bacteroidota bacterium]
MSETQKHTKPNVPNLRFPGFEGEWEVRSLGGIVDIRSGVSPTGIVDKQGTIPYYKVEQLNNCFIELGETPYFAMEDLIPAYSIVFPKRGAAIMTNKIRLSSHPCQLDTNLMALTVKDDRVDYRFLFYFLQRCQLSKIADTSTIPQINNIHINPIRVHLPSMLEQKKIASFLYSIDKMIETQIKVIEHYESLIRAIILRTQLAFSRRKVYLRDILTERKELNELGYDICSVSVSKGVVNQVEYLGRSYAAKETTHYHVVHKGDIIYTKSPTGEFPYGIIKQSYLDSPVAVSPLYGVYEPTDYLTGVYLHHFFCSPQNAKNYLHKLIQKGAKNTINITNQHFLDNYIFLPEPEQLSLTVSAIEALSAIVTNEHQMLSYLKQQKDFFLSSLFV